ncbi:hypothetical protein SAMN04490189_2382 [Pseudomonas koreensis]|uniref:DUF6124 family protein n=1 Tax=Pseudomonas koreensis TaxID=198620 RepID=UPI000879E08E|nr:DUF6124 family protein [Pseudomonas koreensis]KAB0512505.1 hypothetical protein F7R05_15725 [Pseudomonas koreensis]NNA62026.1 hypothetical protein [Pseudomonas koreensis]GGK09585.1 hypothetical protein GCM10009103_00850 [Pseudomonas koreensis]SDD41904.1 hypothetical protein SAMN04490189_2382 [Pseudomonas koreensis]
MFKVTPNPPDTEPAPHNSANEAQRMKEAADRAIGFYLDPKLRKSAEPARKPSTIFLIDPAVDNETLLVHACESLASASIMASDLAGFIDGPQRNSLLGIQQVIMLGELAVNRVLDNLAPIS